MIPVIASLISSGLKTNQEMSNARRGALDNTDQLRQKRQERLLAQQQVQPEGQITQAGMSFADDARKRQEQIFNAIAAKYSGQNAGTL
jgi:hypothetical protein